MGQGQQYTCLTNTDSPSSGDDAGDVWADFAETHFPHGHGPLAVLKAYVDASVRGEPALLTVAAYLIDSSRVRRFSQEWRDTFGSVVFSWADFVGRSGPFKSLLGRDNDAEHSRLIAAAIRIIRENVLGGSVVSIWVKDVEDYSPTFIKGFGHAYSVAGHMAIAGIGLCAERNDIRGGIAYVIEAGDAGYDHLEHLLSAAAKSPDVRALYHWSGHSVIPKMPNDPFHAPDTLAWEWGKFMLETGIERKRMMRMSLVHLLYDRLNRYSFQHLYGQSLLRFFNRIRDLGVEQMQEDADALRSVQSMDVSEAIQASGRSERDEGLE